MSRGRPKKERTARLKASVLRLYKEGWSAGAISKKLSFSKSYVARIVRELKEENPQIINNHLRESQAQDFSFSAAQRKNVHAMKIRAFVHWMGDSYKKSSSQYFKNFVDGVDVGCQGKFIYLSTRDRRFYAESEQKAMWKSLSFWQGVLAKLEERLGVVIMKRGTRAFEFLYHEYETQDSVVAYDAEERGHVWRVFHAEDGKLRLSVDWSEGTPNHETHHKRDSHVDSVVFEKHVNSILDNPQAPTFAELSKTVQQIAAVNQQTAEGLKAVVDVMKSNIQENKPPLDENFVSWYHG